MLRMRQETRRHESPAEADILGNAMGTEANQVATGTAEKASTGGGLERGLGLKEAVALNMIEIVGIGPFVVSGAVIKAMGGPQALLAWLAGALLATLDAFVWSELGAAMPKAGGTYVFLRGGLRAGALGAADVVSVCVADLCAGAAFCSLGFHRIHALRGIPASADAVGGQGGFGRAGDPPDHSAVPAHRHDREDLVAVVGGCDGDIVVVDLGWHAAFQRQAGV
jgi:hypothetical protein